MVKLRIKIDEDVYEVEVDVVEDNPQPGFVPPARGPAAPVSAPGTATPADTGQRQPVADESLVLRSPVSGVVNQIGVAPGDTIEQDTELLVLEAMKMETVVAAARSGCIKAVHATVGGSVKNGDVLIEFEADM